MWIAIQKAFFNFYFLSIFLYFFGLFSSLFFLSSIHHSMNSTLLFNKLFQLLHLFSPFLQSACLSLFLLRLLYHPFSPDLFPASVFLCSCSFSLSLTIFSFSMSLHLLTLDVMINWMKKVELEQKKKKSKNF